MSQFHGQWRRPSSSRFSHVPILEPIDDTSESSFAARSRARSSSSGFGIFSERHLDLYLESKIFTPDPSDEIVPQVDTFTPEVAKEIKALPPANRSIEQNNNYVTFPQVLEHRRLVWLVHQKSIKSKLKQHNADPEVGLAASWEPSTSSSLQPYQRQNEGSKDARRNIPHAQSCGDILEESDTQKTVKYWKIPSRFKRARRAKSEAVVRTEAINVIIESQRKKEGRSGWRKVKAFFSKK